MPAILKFRRGSSIPFLTKAEPWFNDTDFTLSIGTDDTGSYVTLLASNITNVGSLTMTGDVSGDNGIFAGDVNVGGNITIGGNIILGDETVDEVTINASLSGSLVPLSGSVFDIGSPTKHWRNGYFDNIYATNITASAVDYGDILNKPTLFSGSGQVDHDTTINFVASEHIDHVDLRIQPGLGLSGGGILTTTRTLTLDTGSAHFQSGALSEFNRNGLFSSSLQVDLTQTTNYIDGIKQRLNIETVISGSSQVDVNDTQNFTPFSSSVDYRLNNISGSYLLNTTDTLTGDLTVTDNIRSLGIDVIPGVNWLSQTPSTPTSWKSVTYGNNIFVAVSSDGTLNRVMTSPDGVNWTTRTPASDNYWTSVTYGRGLFVAVSNTGTSNRIMTSEDGITWISRTSPLDFSWNSVTYGNGIFVAVSIDGIGNRIMTSPDGITWTTVTQPSNSAYTDITYGNGKFVIVSTSGDTNLVTTSEDGVTWTDRTASSVKTWDAVTYGNGLFVAVSYDGGVMTSPDGITWTDRTPASSNQWKSVTYGRGLFVAVSSNGSPNQVMTSSDGINWTSRVVSSNKLWQSIVYGNGMFVSVATNGVMTSGVTNTTELYIDYLDYRNHTHIPTLLSGSQQVDINYTQNFTPFSASVDYRIENISSVTGSFLLNTTDTLTGTLTVTDVIEASTGSLSNLTTNVVPYNDGTYLVDSMIYNSGSYIGIGMVTPLHTLDINGDVRIQTITSDSTSNSVLVENSGVLEKRTLQSIILEGGDTGSADGQMTFWDNTGSKWAHTELLEMRWDDVNKHLGIGVPALDTLSSVLTIGGSGEDAALSVQGIIGYDLVANFRDSDGENLFKTQGTLAGGDALIRFGDMDGINSGVYFEVDESIGGITFHGLNTSTSDSILVETSGLLGKRTILSFVTDFIELGTEQGQMLFWDDSISKYTHTTGSELVWDDTNKRLGIGITNPTSTLDISGSFSITSNTLVTNLNSDILDDQHGSYYLDFPNFTNVPTLVSGSTQIDVNNTQNFTSFSSSVDNRLDVLELTSASLDDVYEEKASSTHTLVSESIQVNADDITNFDINVLTYINSQTVVSGSTQIDVNNTQNFTPFSSSIDYRLDVLELTSTSLDSTYEEKASSAHTLFSGSIQVNANTITNFDINVLDYINSQTVISGSTQIDVNNTQNFTPFSSSVDYRLDILEITSASHDDRLDQLETVTASLDSTYEEIASSTHTLVSGSSQIDVTDTQNFTPFSSSVDYRLDLLELSSASLYDVYEEIASSTHTLVSSSTQIDVNDTQNFTLFSSSVDDRLDILELTSESLDSTYEEIASSTHTLVSGSSQINIDDVTGFTAYSESVDTRIDGISDVTGSYLLNTTDIFTGNLTLSGSITASDEVVVENTLYIGDSYKTKFDVGTTNDSAYSVLKLYTSDTGGSYKKNFQFGTDPAFTTYSNFWPGSVTPSGTNYFFQVKDNGTETWFNSTGIHEWAINNVQMMTLNSGGVGVNYPYNTPAIPAKLAVRGSGTTTGTSFLIVDSNYSQSLKVLDNGNTFIDGDISGSGRLYIETVDTNTTSTDLVVLNGTEFETRTHVSLINEVGVVSGSSQINIDDVTGFTSYSASVDYRIEHISAETGSYLLNTTDTLTGTLTVTDTLNVVTGSIEYILSDEVHIMSASLSYQENLDVDSTAPEVVATLPTGSNDGVFFDYIVKNGVNIRAGIVMAAHNGVSVTYTDFSTTDLGDTSGVVLTVDENSGNLRLLATTTTDDWTVKSLVRGL